MKRTQVSLFCRRMFACVSFLRARSRAELPAHWITVSFGLPVPCDSRRVDRCVEAARNRWTHHLIVGSPEELDGELLGLLKEAYDFADRTSR